MGLIESMMKKPEKKRDLGVCIPEHAKPVADSVSEELFPEKPKAFIPKGSFLVEGVYDLKHEKTLTVKVLRGTLSKDSKVMVEDAEIPVSELQMNGKAVERLKNGESGAIVVRPEFFVRIMGEDVLEFK